MANDLQKLLGRNLRYTQMREQVDFAIKQLQGNFSPEAQMQMNALKQQRQNIDNLMAQPMTEQEYAQYDDNGYYIGNAPQQAAPQNTGGIGQALVDGMNHAAQGTSLGWSDEAFGTVGGVGRVMANAASRALGYDVNGESFGDAWNKGYQEYRDFARQELQDGFERNPAISAGAEVVGAAISPITPFKAKGWTGSLGKKISHPEDIARARWQNSIASGIVNGIGYTHQNTPLEYVKNIGKSVGTNVVGTLGGNFVFGSYNDMNMLGRGVMNATTQSVPHAYRYFKKEDEDG